MQLKELFTDDDAVSPVIGVILMVAITVILAAVIGAFVLDIGGSQESAPQVQWEWTDNPGGTADMVQLEHGGGDTVNNPSQITVQDSNSANTADGTTLSGDSWTTGTTVDLAVDDTQTGTLELVWESSDGSTSQTLSEHDYDVDS